LRLRHQERLGFLIRETHSPEKSASMKILSAQTFFGVLVLAAAVACGEITPVVAPVAEPFPMTDVRLLDGPFRDAMLRDQRYLLSLDPDRFLFNFRKNSGLDSSARPYGGWDSPGCEQRGAMLGHYLTACSQMYAGTGDAEFKRRVDYIIAGLAECQSNSVSAGFHAGYLSAFPESFIDRVENGKPVWAPWYALHKIMAGLLSANQLCDNQQALEVLTNMADWVKFRVDRLSPEQMQKSLDTEHGGMNEVLANLYAVTGDKNYLRLAEAFNHQRVFAPLARGEDRLNGLHANTQIPKMIGSLREYELTGDPQFLTVATTFWDAVALERSYVIGGDSDHEHFFPTNAFDKHLSTDTAETCNTYNMLKLTRKLFALRPDAVKMDFYERALYNHILASQDPETGMFVYLMSLKPGHFKSYSTPEDSFWCCVGTGMENHSKYGDTIYFHDGDSLYVNLYIASELSWPEKNLVVRQETRFPAQDSTLLKIKTAKLVTFALKIRRPAWATNGFSASVNGRKQSITSTPGSYFTLLREWSDGDQIEIHFPMSLHTEPLPGTSNTVAILYGPIVLAGEMGTNAMPNPITRDQTDYSRLPAPDAPVFIGEAGTILKRVRPVAGEPLKFRTHDLGRPRDVTLIPFYQMHRERYSVYWKVLSATEWRAQAAELKAAEAKRLAAEALVVDEVRPGEQQSETDHRFQASDTQTGDFDGRKWRHAAGWFSYELKMLPDQRMQLAFTLWGSDDGAREFDVTVDGSMVDTEKLHGNRPGEFYEMSLPLPPELTRGKKTVTVKFVAHPGNLAGGIYGVRILKFPENSKL
jgi:DUF1680 family protein